jgi:hypothetical protein
MLTTKHLKKMETYEEPKPQDPEEEGLNEEGLKERVIYLEDTIKVLMKRIDQLEQNQSVQQPVQPVQQPVQHVEEPESPKQTDQPKNDIDDIIHHIEQTTFIDWNEFRKDDGSVDYEKYVEKRLEDCDRKAFKQEENPFELLRHTYKEDSQTAIYKKMRKLIPEDIIKVNDVSRSKFSIFSNGKWLNSVDSAEKLEEIIKALQNNISDLDIIHSTAKDMYGRPVTADQFADWFAKSHQGKDIYKPIVKDILEAYK